jgi:hypothetical protein
MVSGSAVDRDRFDADLDPKSHVDPDPDPERIKTIPIHMLILPQVLQMLENLIYFLLTFTVVTVHIGLSFSSTL